MPNKQRADILLVEQGLFESREQAKRAIMAGQVRVGPDHVVARPSERWPADTLFTVVPPSPYVSRGAEKLKPALDKHLPDLSGLTALDVGASTGGFTDLMLQRGAARVYAVDAGHGQLHLKLREDPRVICLEKVNARYLTRDDVPESVQVLSADLSFISLTKVVPVVAPWLEPGGWAFLLIKPQFEAARAQVGRGGVVRDESVRVQVIEDTASAIAECTGWQRLDLIAAPPSGPRRNREELAVFRRT